MTVTGVCYVICEGLIRKCSCWQSYRLWERAANAYHIEEIIICSNDCLWREWNEEGIVHERNGMWKDLHVEEME